MTTMSKHHQELTNGVGCCSVPMWWMGVPAGFCDEPAYGKSDPKKYDGYVGGLACPVHGGPSREESLNLCAFCKHCAATCASTPKFGTGIGNDNVYECSKHEPRLPGG